ncbi:MAG: bisanhydrobacterioruberin hydratase [Candidatus Nanohaloarchaea archaeon]
MERLQKLKKFDLKKLVAENRFTISVIFPIVGALTLLASAEGILNDTVIRGITLPLSVLSFNPYLILFGTLVMRLPLIAGTGELVDRKAAIYLSLLTIYSYIIEYVGTTTGFPYGEFRYGVSLGPMLPGNIPLALPIFFIPLVVNSYLLVLLLAPEKSRQIHKRLPASLATLIIFDLVLDPAAVSLDFWDYASGAFYGVPLTNFAGWLLSGTVAVGALELAFDRSKLVERLRSIDFMLDDVVSFVFLWGAVNIYFGNILPAFLAAVLGLGLLRSGRYDHYLNSIRSSGSLRHFFSRSSAG